MRYYRLWVTRPIWKRNLPLVLHILPFRRMIAKAHYPMADSVAQYPRMLWPSRFRLLIKVISDCNVYLPSCISNVRKEGEKRKCETNHAFSISSV